MRKTKKPIVKQLPLARPSSFAVLLDRYYIPAGIIIIIAAAFFVYYPALNGGFILDDDKLIVNNYIIHAPDGLYRFWLTKEATDYWPISNSSLWIEWRIWGLDTLGYHVTNLILHIVESLLIWLILRKLSIPGAFLAAALFAVHPVNVESVAWISQRKGLMAMLFFLLSIWCYLKTIIPSTFETIPVPALSTIHRPPPTTHLVTYYCLSLISFFLAMLSKGSVAVMPILLLGIIWWLRPVRVSDLLRLLPFLIVAAVMAGVNVWFQTHGKVVEMRDVSVIQRILGAGGVIWFYLYKAFLPFDLSFVYPQWNIQATSLWWWLPLLAALSTTLILWNYRNIWSRPFLFAWGFFCVSLIPVMGFTDVGFMVHSLVCDHYQHISIIAVVTLAAAGCETYRNRYSKSIRWLANYAAIIVLGVFALLAWQQSGIYKNTVTLYEATLVKNPGCWMAHNNLGTALAQNGKPHEAIEHFQEALKYNPKYPDAENNLGAALGDVGRPEEALIHCQNAIHLKPDFVKAYNNLAISLVKMGNFRDAFNQYDTALKLAPNEAELHFNRAVAYEKSGQFDKAINGYSDALRISPNLFVAHCNMGNMLFQMGRLQEAVEHYQVFLKIRPNEPEIHNNIAINLAQLGRLQEAIEHYEAALRLSPNMAKAHNNLGIALAQTGRLQEAFSHFQQAVKLEPNYIDAHKNLAVSYAQLNRPTDAIASAQKALELAKSQKQEPIVKQIEQWLEAYRADLSKSPGSTLNDNGPAMKP